MKRRVRERERKEDLVLKRRGKERRGGEGATPDGRGNGKACFREGTEKGRRITGGRNGRKEKGRNDDSAG
jgi:hypothetical protein